MSGSRLDAQWGVSVYELEDGCGSAEGGAGDGNIVERGKVAVGCDSGVGESACHGKCGGEGVGVVMVAQVNGGLSSTESSMLCAVTHATRSNSPALSDIPFPPLELKMVRFGRNAEHAASSCAMTRINCEGPQGGLFQPYKQLYCTSRPLDQPDQARLSSWQSQSRSAGPSSPPIAYK